MIAKSVIETDAFLDMPAGAQSLYFHLTLRADDDGFISSPKGLMRSVCAKEQDMQNLIANKFVISFDSGVVVIRHWRQHNTIQKDRYKPTDREEMGLLRLTESNVYERIDGVETECFQTGSKMETECIQDGSKMETQVSIGKVSIDKYNNTPLTPQRGRRQESKLDGFQEFWSAYPKKQAKGAAEKAFSKIHPDKSLLRQMLDAIELHKKSSQWQKDGGQYIPMPSTWLNQKRWEDDLIGHTGRDSEEEQSIYARAFS